MQYNTSGLLHYRVDQVVREHWILDTTAVQQPDSTTPFSGTQCHGRVNKPRIVLTRDIIKASGDGNMKYCNAQNPPIQYPVRPKPKLPRPSTTGTRRTRRAKRPLMAPKVQRVCDLDAQCWVDQQHTRQRGCGAVGHTDAAHQAACLSTWARPQGTECYFICPQPQSQPVRPLTAHSGVHQMSNLIDKYQRDQQLGRLAGVSNVVAKFNQVEAAMKDANQVQQMAHKSGDAESMLKAQYAMTVADDQRRQAMAAAAEVSKNTARYGDKHSVPAFVSGLSEVSTVSARPKADQCLGRTTRLSQFQVRAQLYRS